MKLAWSNTRARLAGLALIVLTNAVALSGVAYNRSGEPQAMLRLTERELQIPYWSWPDNDNSGIDLRLRWRVHDTYANDESNARYWDRTGAWLNAEKLRLLGFDTSIAVTDFELDSGTTSDPSRNVFLVLEHDGAAYQAVLQHCRKRLQRVVAETGASVDQVPADVRVLAAKQRLDAEVRFESRLFVVDAGLDAAELRTRYPERDRYAVVRGQVDLVLGSLGKSSVLGRITGLDIERIRVPHAQRSIVEPFADRASYANGPNDPRFAATVSFGQRFEPWIVDLTKM